MAFAINAANARAGFRRTGSLDFAVALSVRRGDEAALFRKRLERRWRLAEMIGEQIGRNAGDPLRQVDGLVLAGPGWLPIFSIEWP
jgi:hypothetical protein